MMHLAAMAVALAAMQDGAEQRIRAAADALERAQREYRMSLVQLGPEAIPALEKKAEGPHKETIKQAIGEIRRLKETLEKLMAQLASEDVAVRDQATAELAGIGRPARPYLEASRKHADAEVRARVDVLLRRLEKPGRSELEMIRAREREEIQNLRVEAMKAEVERGMRTSLDLVRARTVLERYRLQNGSIPLDVYLKSTRKLLAEELELEERRFAAGTATAVDVLKVRIQLLYADRRLGNDASEEIIKAIREVSGHLRLQASRGLVRELDALGQILELSTDRNEDLD